MISTQSTGDRRLTPSQREALGKFVTNPFPLAHPSTRGSTLHPDFRPFSESASSAGAGLKAATVKVLWWHVCNSHP